MNSNTKSEGAKKYCSLGFNCRATDPKHYEKFNHTPKKYRIAEIDTPSWEQEFAESPLAMVLEKIDQKYADERTGYLLQTVKSLLAHQRQQAYEEGYNAGVADEVDLNVWSDIAIAKEKVEQIRQQAVAEFAREVIDRIYASNPNVTYKELQDILAEVEYAAKQRGIQL